MALYKFNYGGQCVVEADSPEDVTLDDLFNGNCVAFDAKMTDVEPATEFDAKLIRMTFTDN